MGNVFNAEKFVSEELGGQFAGVNEDGSLNVKLVGEDGEEQVKKFNLPQMLKDEGVDTSKVEFKYNSPETALEENALGFKAALKLNFTRTNDDKLKALQEEFGEGNVEQVDEGFRVKENGVWKRADTSFFQNFVANSPIMAAGIAGSVKGAAIGSAIPVVGTAVGAVVGGALSATIAKASLNEIAEQVGVRSEQDLDEVAKEIGKDFVNNVVWDAALLGAGKALKPVAQYAGKTVQRAFRATLDKTGIAATAEKLLPGTKQADWSTILRSADDAKAVMSDMDKVIKWETQKASGANKSAIDPATDLMNKWVVKSMTTFKRKAFTQYDDTMKAIDGHGQFAKAKVSVDGTLSNFEKTLTEMGLLRSGDGGLEFLTKSQAANADEIMTLFDAKSRNTLKQVWQTMSNAAKREGHLPFRDTKKLLDGIDDILEGSGYYKGGELAISNQARRALKGIRHEIRNKMSDSLGDKLLIRNGKMTSARNLFDDASLKYSQFRQHYDDFAMTSRFGGDASQVAATVNRMFGESGMALEESFGNMARAVGTDGTKVLNRLQQLRAAKNLSPIYSPSQTGLQSVISGTLGYSSPRTMAKGMANRSMQINQPPSQAKLVATKAIAQTNEFLKSLPQTDRYKLLSNPEMYRQLVDTMLAAPELADQTEQELLSPLAGGE